MITLKLTDRDRSVLYGSNLLCSVHQTWSWGLDASSCLPADEACWRALSSPTLPDTCSVFALAYDEARDRVVLHGGKLIAQGDPQTVIKSPQVAEGLYPENDLFIQSTKLKNTLRHWMGEDLITHLGSEYYEE